ncbi:MAG: ATP-binding cassette domain-containing protein [Bacteroidales bacterium]|nr:ATP-binding cassette domain-containing protein [Bacteroidales bacterium]
MINAKAIHKRFGTVKALKGIDLDIKEGELYGLLGPNGAGKTTTINILSTLLKPDNGSVFINGLDILKNPVSSKKNIGIVPQEVALYEDLSALDNLLFWGGLYGNPASQIRSRANEMLRLFGLSDRRNDTIKKYSGGMKRRINIASALLHNPKVLFMDEPTVGIDPQSRNKIYEVIGQLHSNGLTIIYTTHYMEEVEKLCERVGIIDYGEIIAEGTVEELRNRSNTTSIINVALENPGNANLKDLQKSFETVEVDQNNQLVFRCKDSDKKLSGIVKYMDQHNLMISSIDVKKASLENIFLELTGRKLRD